MKSCMLLPNAHATAITVLFSMFTVDEAAVNSNPMLAIQTKLMYTVIFNSRALSIVNNSQQSRLIVLYAR